jgi:hypothetical protein
MDFPTLKHIFGYLAFLIETHTAKCDICRDWTEDRIEVGCDVGEYLSHASSDLMRAYCDKKNGKA